MNDDAFELRFKPGEELVITLRNPFRGSLSGGETAEHIRVARTEVLKAMRSALDVVIESLADRAGESGRPRRRVKVE
jgi:hypothetical protein